MINKHDLEMVDATSRAERNKEGFPSGDSYDVNIS